MIFTCTRENLHNALSLVTGLTTKNVNLPILSNILIKATDQKIELISTNLELAITTSLRAKIEQVGSYTVPAKTLLDYINLLEGEKIEVKLKDNELIISCDKTKTKIKGISADDYPIIPDIKKGNEYLISSDDLKKSLTQVNLATAKNDIRPELSGVLFSFNSEDNENKLILAATDSYRLAEKKIKLIQGNESNRVIIPGRTAQEIIHILNSSNELINEKNVKLILSENQIVIIYNEVQIISRLIEGQYPDYTQIIPKNFNTEIIFSLKQMVKEIKAASIFTTIGINSISFEFDHKEEKVLINSISSQTGEYRSQLEVEIKGDSNNILLNNRYLLDGLNSLDSENVELKMINSDSPCILTGKDDPNYLYIVMPIRQ